MNPQTDLITVEWLYAQGIEPCKDYTEYDLKCIFGEGKTILELLQLNSLSFDDMMFVLDCTNSTGFLRRYPVLRKALRDKFRVAYLWGMLGPEDLSTIIKYVTNSTELLSKEFSE